MGTPLILAKEAKMQPHPFLSFLAFPLPFFSFHLFPVLLSAFGHNKLVISSSLLCETRKSAAQNSEDNWKHSCFRRTAAHRDFFDYCALSYLLTYFLHSHFLSLSLLHSPPSTLLFPRGREATPLTQLGSLGERCKLPTVGSKKIHYLFILGIFCACETYLVVATVFVLSVRNSVVFEANLAFTFPGTGRCSLGRSQVGQVPCCPSLRAPMLLHALCETLRFRFHGDV